MFYKFFMRSITILGLFVVVGLTSAPAQPTAFKYQGSITDAGTPANGSFQMQFKLFDAASGGTQIGSTLSDLPVTATNGVFSVSLDFGSAALTGANRWLEIAVRRNAGESYITLSPREQISSSPYAVRTLSAATADLALDSQKLGGINASEYVTTSTVGGSFIKNDTVQQTANFNISGTGVVGNLLGVGRPATPGVRIDSQGTIRSIDSSSTSIVAETTGGTNAWARFYARTPNRSWAIGSSRNFNGDQLYFVDDTSGQIRIAIQPAGGPVTFPLGDIGINNAAPQAKLHAVGNVAVRGDSASGTGYGVYGTNTTATGWGVLGVNDAVSASARGVVGVSASGQGVTGLSVAGHGVVGTTQTGTGVYAQSTGVDVGRAIYAEGDAAQSRNKGGFIKGMALVNGDGTLLRCFNGVTGLSTGNCGGITSSRGPFASGTYNVNFPFQVSDRFVSVSVANAGWGVAVSYDFDAAANTRVRAFVHETRSVGVFVDRPVMVIVY